jgi:DDE domain
MRTEHRFQDSPAGSHSHRLLVDLPQDRCLARLGLGARLVALISVARRFFIRALRAGTVPAEVTTDQAPAYPRVLDELIPSALHTVERYANNPVETDHGRLKARLRPMRGPKRRGPRGSSPPGTPSCRTSAAATERGTHAARNREIAGQWLFRWGRDRLTVKPSA